MEEAMTEPVSTRNSTTRKAKRVHRKHARSDLDRCGPSAKSCPSMANPLIEHHEPQDAEAPMQRNASELIDTDTRHKYRRKKGAHQKPEMVPETQACTASCERAQPNGRRHIDELERLVTQVNAGNTEALERLRVFLNSHPDVWAVVGDLGRHVELSWLDLIAAGNVLLLESLRRWIAEYKADLAGPKPTRIERGLVDLIASTLLSLRHYEQTLAESGSNSATEAVIRLRRAESAQRRHLAAMRTLVTLRALVPQGMKSNPSGL